MGYSCALTPRIILDTATEGVTVFAVSSLTVRAAAGKRDCRIITYQLLQLRLSLTKILFVHG